MKNLALIATFLAFFTANVFAQDGGGEGLRIGLQLSPTFSFINSDDNTINNNGTNLGLKLQVMSETYFQENYAFTLGFGFAFNHGGTLQYDEGGALWRNTLGEEAETFPAGVDLKYEVQYVEVPVGLKLRTREFGYIKYFAEPNLIFGFKTKARGTAKGNEDLENLNIAEDVNSLAASWGIGGGIEYSISDATSIISGLYFQRLFTDITDDGGGDASKGSMSAITIRLGVLF
ncbi:MAG: outer membrane beta-barrel protein [Saprospiraceae bacterium]